MPSESLIAAGQVRITVRSRKMAATRAATLTEPRAPLLVATAIPGLLVSCRRRCQVKLQDLHAECCRFDPCTPTKPSLLAAPVTCALWAHRRSARPKGLDRS